MDVTLPRPSADLRSKTEWKTDIFNSDICKIILAIILPPLGVFLERGCGADLLINILLTILGYIPGIIHALSVTKSPYPN
jgi:uncharacterized membrane protein YqaE (UPF0057 family)